MRRLAAWFAAVVLLSALVASATLLGLDGGTVQTFLIETEIEVPTAADERTEDLLENEQDSAKQSAEQSTFTIGLTDDPDGASDQ